MPGVASAFASVFLLWGVGVGACEGGEGLGLVELKRKKRGGGQGVQEWGGRSRNCQKYVQAIVVTQDKFDHDKGQKSAISGRCLHWRLSTGFFAFSPGSLCNLVRRAP